MNRQRRLQMRARVAGAVVIRNGLLGELRLPTIKHLWPRLAERADTEGWPAARFLAAWLLLAGVPTLAFVGLYQVNVQVPTTTFVGPAVPLAIATTNAFVDFVDIAIGM